MNLNGAKQSRDGIMCCVQNEVVFCFFSPPDASDVQKPEALADYRESAVRLAFSK